MKQDASTPQDCTKCPYWALERNKECGMVKGGMYIPMPEHIAMYCHSTKFYQCQKYIKGIEMTEKREEFVPKDVPGNGDRRRLRRYPEQIYLDLVACDRNVGIQVMKAYKAKSLDLSLGGLRLESFKEFPTDVVVSFVIDPDFSSDSLLGVGEVKWCIPKKGSNKFESGIAFLNYSTSESVREYLEI